MRKLYRLFLIPLLFLSSSHLMSCSSSSSLEFDKMIYEVKSGDKVRVKSHHSGITYSFINNDYENLSVDSRSGLITFDESVLNYSQVLYQATYKEYKSDIVTLTLIHNYGTPTLTFNNPINYLRDGDYIIVSNSLGLANTYSLENKIAGISVDSTNGLISINEEVKDNTEFTVVVSSNGVSVSQNFYVAKDNIVLSKTDVQTIEEGSSDYSAYYLDFTSIDIDKFEEKVIAVSNKNNIIDSQYYEYDEENKRLIIKDSYYSLIDYGVNNIKIYTPRNSVSVDLIYATKFISNVKDLISINENKSSLNGYYIQTNDIDLSFYLSTFGEGYNEGKGWNPIGTYKDVTDGTNLENSFQGTYDGDGYSITGFYINRSDEFAYNAGLFGYVSTLGSIQNLRIVTSEAQNKVRSYAGILAGVCEGEIKNCISEGNISNYSGEYIFKNLGGLVGRNAGTITSCFSLASVSGDDSTGNLVGSNEGKIINSYSYKQNDYDVLIGSGYDSSDSFLFTTLDEMKSYDFKTYLSSNNWDFLTNELPILKHNYEHYFVTSISIANENLNYVRNEKITLDINIKPEKLWDEYINKIDVICDDEHTSISGLTLDTSSSDQEYIVVTISLALNNKILTDSVTFHIYSSLDYIILDANDFKVIIPGEEYLIKPIISPSNIKDTLIDYEVSPSTNLVNIKDSVLTVDENITSTLSFSLKAKSSNVISNTIDITVNPLHNKHDVQTYYLDNIPTSILFDISDINGEDLTVSLNHSDLPFVKNDKTIKIDSSLFVMNSDNYQSVKIIDKVNNVGYAHYIGIFDKDSFDISKVENTIFINSVSDLKTYFNISDYKADRFINYGKTYILNADIDFNNEMIYSFGTEEHPFTGTIYGCGHTIRNFKINENEYYFTLSDIEKNNAYRKSLYSVGFIAYLSGEIYDINFDNSIVKANNFVGSLCGTGFENSIVENVHYINSSVLNINEVSYPISNEDKVHYLVGIGNPFIKFSSFNQSITNLF